MNKRWIIFFFAAFLVLLLVVSGFSLLGYAWENVGDTYIAVQLFQNKPWNVVGSGVYTDLRPWAVI